MSSFLDDVRDGFENVIDKTEEYGKIGKIKVDIAGLKRQMDKHYSDLGKMAFKVISEEQDVKSDENIQKEIEKIKSCQTDIANKQAEIAQIKQEKEQERKKRAEERKKERETQVQQKKTDTTKSGKGDSDIEDAKIVNEEKKKK